MVWYAMLCYPMLWNGMEIVVCYEISMICYEISMPYYALFMLQNKKKCDYLYFILKLE